jgi:tryptophan synthase alpha chain
VTRPVEAPPGVGALEVALRRRRDTGSKLLVPYVMAGMSEDWLSVLAAVADAGADALEVGLPFSDPMLDGPVIQEAGLRALERGTTVQGVLAELARADLGVPVAVMTYYNLVFRAGHRRMAASLAASGVAGAIVPDLPLEELDPWAGAADAAGVETVLLVAPPTPPERVRAIVARCRGFCYAVARMGVTGERATLGADAADVVARVRQHGDIPVCCGIGISTPAQAAEICQVADGVVVGSALVRRLLEGAGPEGAARLVGDFRAALG